MRNKKLLFVHCVLNDQELLLCLLRDVYFCQLERKYNKIFDNHSEITGLELDKKVLENNFFIVEFDEENISNPVLKEMVEKVNYEFLSTNYIKLSEDDIDSLEKVDKKYFYYDLTLKNDSLSVRVFDDYYDETVKIDLK